jgi:hypothetical protein
LLNSMCWQLEDFEGNLQIWIIEFTVVVYGKASSHSFYESLQPDNFLAFSIFFYLDSFIKIAVQCVVYNY